MRVPITRELREYATDTEHPELLAIADSIEAEHRYRMDDCRREVRRSLVRYLRGVLTDYDRGIKRVRKGNKVDVIRCRDCVHMDDYDMCDLLHVSTCKDGYCNHAVRWEAGRDD